MAVIRSWARTDVGKKRKHNEDAFLADDALGLYVVADGMGGHAAGEVASAQAVQSIRDALAPNRSILERFANQPSVEARESIAALMETAIQKACADVTAKAATTAVAARTLVTVLFIIVPPWWMCLAGEAPARWG